MINKELLKEEIEKVRDEYLEILYRIIKALESPAGGIADHLKTANTSIKDDEFQWQKFITETYGCLADAPIERGEQGDYEIRKAVE